MGKIDNTLEAIEEILERHKDEEYVIISRELLEEAANDVRDYAYMCPRDAREFIDCDTCRMCDQWHGCNDDDEDDEE